jgi:hypothetical protein
MLEISGYDFLDFGASRGGAIDFALARLGGRRGLGIDVNPAKVRLMREAGYDCIQGDVTCVPLPAGSVRFVTMSHILEHLPGREAVKRAISEAARLATDFLFIQGPFFDGDAYLESVGLKFFWSSWRGHPFHLTSGELHGILLELGLAHHDIQARLKVRDSSDEAIHPLDSPRDQHEYDGSRHPPKPAVVFTRDIYKEIVCYVRLRPLDGWKSITRARKGCVPLYPRPAPPRALPWRRTLS